MLEWHTDKGEAYVVTGTGQGKTPLAAFDFAELDCGIIATNAIPVTSFVPPTWDLKYDKEELKKKTKKGRFIPMAFKYETSNVEPVAASVSVGLSEDEENPGIFMEYADTGKGAKEIEKTGERSVKEVFSFRNWQVKDIISKSAETRPKRNTYACALAAVLFFPEED